MCVCVCVFDIIKTFDLQSNPDKQRNGSRTTTVHVLELQLSYSAVVGTHTLHLDELTANVVVLRP